MTRTLAFLFLIATGVLTAQNSMNFTKSGQWNPTLPVGGILNQKYSACWGMAINGREYAIIGSLNYVHIVDITNPVQPNEIQRFSGNASCVWREFKTYKGRIYAVDDCNGAMMVIDMRLAPQIITRKQYDGVSGHTITLDTLNGKIYLNSNSIVLSVKEDPDIPKIIGFGPLPCGFAHDTYVRNDTLYVSAQDNGLCVYDYADPKAPKLIANLNTGGYNHNNWVTADGKYLYYTEEIPSGRPIHIVDLQKMTTEGEIEVVGQFFNQMIPSSPTDAVFAISHNIYIRDNLLFNSQYEDGLLVYDISDPLKPNLFAWYDTHPQNTQYNTYRGCWGNYPWLPSGTIIASDMQNGLFLLNLKTSGVESGLAAEELRVFPNPATDAVRFSTTGAFDYILFDARGRVAKTGFSQGDIHLAGLPAGVYYLQAYDGEKLFSKVKVVKI